MSDKGAHPGVKSLLARFENSQQSVTSPPPRDRSPAGSDRLSKVRATFVAVGGGSPSNPILGLRTVDGYSESPPPPPRMKSFGSEDIDGSVKSNGSPPLSTNGLVGAQVVTEPETKGTVEETIEAKGKAKVKEETSANKENQPNPRSSTAASGLSATSPTKTVLKKSSNAHISKVPPTTKPTSHAPSSKTPAQPRMPISASKPDDEKPSRSTRASRPSTNTTAKADPPKAPVHKASRTSLTTAPRAPTRPSRASTPAREITKPAPRTSDVRSQSTTKSARLAATTKAPSLSSTARLSTTAGTTATLSRKPSNLKGTSTATRQRAVTPTASSVRKQTSRSPPSQSGSDRPHSRLSASTKPVDEGFLARMMRPTASSASKAHEKIEIKSPPRPRVARAPRRPSSTLEARSNRPTKDKIASEKLQEKTQSTDTPNETQAKEVEQEVEPVQDIAEQSAPKPSTQPASQSPEPVIEEGECHEEQRIDSPVESTTEPLPGHVENHVTDDSDTHAIQLEESPVQPTPKSGAPLEADQEVKIVGDPVEPNSESPEVQIFTPADQTVDQQIEPADTETVKTAEIAETSEPGATTILQEGTEVSSELPLETAPKSVESKPDDLDVDLSQLTLNEKDAST